MGQNTVTIRRRERSHGVIALLLVYYLHGKRREESMNLYLEPETSREAKKRNKDTLAVAEAVRSEKQVQIINGKIGVKDNQQAEFIPFAESVIASKKAHGTKLTWQSMLNVARAYDKREHLLLAEIDKSWVVGFLKYMEHNTTNGRRFSANTIWNYFHRLSGVLNEAVRQNLIEVNPAKSVEAPRMQQAERCYLTIDELKKLAETPQPVDVIRRSFLFACLTGLRRSDIEKMKWSEVSVVNGMVRVTFRQQKTSNLVYLDINQQAADLLGERGRNDELVFPFLPCPESANHLLREWTARAGINKHITFHSGRHTFATMMLTLGADIYTVSKLLGHTDVKTTQIYAKIIDSKKVEAVNRIPDIKI